jgi:transcriptional regulator with XRE-family HTH domain
LFRGTFIIARDPSGPRQDRLKTLGLLFREKRRGVTPKECGITTSRRRLSPGLSRAEAAALADIGSSWYARLEAGRVQYPTIATLRAIARVLKLTPDEFQFTLELAAVAEAEITVAPLDGAVGRDPTGLDPSESESSSS